MIAAKNWLGAVVKIVKHIPAKGNMMVLVIM